MRIGLLSDTHSHLDDKVLKHLKGCDEIWHAGDIGELEVTDKLSEIAPLRAVYGNIDGAVIRSEFPLDQTFSIEGINIWITHIGGRPPRFAPGILTKLKSTRPDIFICGHSHILIAKSCAEFGGLHLNPGAAGLYGNHHVRTLMRFDLTSRGVENLEVVEIQRETKT
jgi:putative phosphoesterase